MTACISLELKQIDDHWAVHMLSVSEDPAQVRDETYKFVTEDEARDGLLRATLYAEDLRKNGTVTSIKVRGDLVGVDDGRTFVCDVCKAERPYDEMCCCGATARCISCCEKSGDTPVS